MITDYIDQLFGVGPLITSLNTTPVSTQIPDIPKEGGPVMKPPILVDPPAAAQPAGTTVDPNSLINWFFLLIGLVIIAIAYDRDNRAGAMLVIILLLGLMLTAKNRGFI